MFFFCNGARYYDPRTSVWQSPDPILGEYMSGQTNGGVFNPKNLSLFTYTYNNPVNFVDPDGNSAKSKIATLGTVFTKNSLKNAKNRAVSSAWKMEMKLVQSTGQGDGLLLNLNY